IKVRATNLDGEKIVFEATGLLSRALQHEVDHLQGILFIDRMKSATRTALASRLKRMQKGGAGGDFRFSIFDWGQVARPSQFGDRPSQSASEAAPNRKSKIT